MHGLAQSLRQRVPWSVASRILKEQQLPRGQGWDRTVERLCSGDYQDANTIAGLQAALREHILYGEKLVRIYDLDEKKNSAVEIIQNVKIKQTSFAKRFPETLPEDELTDTSAEPVLVYVEESDEAVSAVFASVRAMQLRESVPTDEIPDEAKGILGNYDEVVGIKNVRYEAFDVISISRKSPRAVVLIDHPLGASKDSGVAAHTQIVHCFSKIVGQNILSQPINLFPLINAMYRARSEGVVVELAFGTSTASLKHEKMRRKSLCLREEAYHKGGKAALSTPIEPHRLSIIWRRPLASGGSSAPELSLHTTTTIAGSPLPVLWEAEIRKCIGVDDFSYVNSRIEYFLSQKKK